MRDLLGELLAEQLLGVAQLVELLLTYAERLQILVDLARFDGLVARTDDLLGDAKQTRGERRLADLFVLL